MIWDNQSYAVDYGGETNHRGAGAGSITKRVDADGLIRRCENVKDVAQYIERIDEMIERKKALLGDF